MCVKYDISYVNLICTEIQFESVTKLSIGFKERLKYCIFCFENYTIMFGYWRSMRSSK